jgi:hypothetical protein
MQVDESLACLLQFVDDNIKEGFGWTLLGSLYDKKGKSFFDHATLSFKQAFKLNGNFPKYIDTWHYVGPFVVGKTEFDGDPIQAYGGIENVSRSRWDTKVTFPSELVPGGQVGWKEIKQQSMDQAVVVAPQVNWNNLVSSLQSMAITGKTMFHNDNSINHYDDIIIIVQSGRLGGGEMFVLLI